MRKYALFTVAAALSALTSVMAWASPPEAPAPRPVDPTAARVRALLARIDDDPDPLHRENTPAVRELIQVGEPAILPTLDVMLSDDRDTRLRAQTVLQGITGVLHGCDLDKGWMAVEDQAAWEKFWADLGGLNWKAPREEREASVALWKKWLAGRPKK